MTISSSSTFRPCGWKAAVGVFAVAGLALGSSVAGAAPPTVPGAPTIKSVTALRQAIRVAFTRPASNGGAHITRYKATCVSSDGGVTRSNGDDRSPIRVVHLTAGKTYTCTVAARNKVGFGPASAPSAAVVVLPNPPPTVPGAPTIKSVTALRQAIRVAFTRPASNGGAHITRYKATCVSSDGGVTRSNGDDRSPIRVVHLTAAKTYTCTVAARNKVGIGPASAPSAAVVVLPNPPPTVPGAPTIKSVTALRQAIRVAFTRPASNGGAHITRYKATCVSSDGGVTRSNGDDRSPIRVVHLTAGKTYTCTVAARNKVGFGPASAPSAAGSVPA